MSITMAANMMVMRSNDWYKFKAYLVIENGKNKGMPSVVK
jgi:hypothetical protein